MTGHKWRHRWVPQPRVLTTGDPYKWTCANCGSRRVSVSDTPGLKGDTFRFYSATGPYIGDRPGRCTGPTQHKGDPQ